MSIDAVHVALPAFLGTTAVLLADVNWRAPCVRRSTAPKLLGANMHRIDIADAD
jgi:hypothetical protein